MQSSFSEVSLFTILISTLLILLFAAIIIYFIFLYQKKRYRHERELLELHETFSKTLLQSKLEIQEQTLDHIAKELHANFGHIVSLININLSELLSRPTESMKEGIIETKSLAKQLLTEMKALSASLNTDHIMHIGFVDALNNELERLAKLKKYQIRFTKCGEEYRLPAEHEIILFRLCQEIFNNTVKYAKASAITVSINYQPSHFLLEITDNGIGFNLEIVSSQSAAKESTGFVNMKKRAKLINAELIINSGDEGGTSIHISIPRNLTTKNEG